MPSKKAFPPIKELKNQADSFLKESGVDFDVTSTIKELEEEMLAAANNLEFEKAAHLRDQIRELKRATGDGKAEKESRKVSYGKQKRGGRKVKASR